MMSSEIPKVFPQPSEQNPLHSSSESSKAESDSVYLLAQEILSQEAEKATPELKELVNLFKKENNSVDLSLLQVYLKHLHSLDGSDEIAQTLWKTILVNTQGRSILPLLYSPVVLHITPQTVPYLKEVAHDPDLMQLWLQFSFASPPDLDMNKIPPEWLKKFLMSPLGEGHRASYSFTDKGNPTTNVKGDYIQVTFLGGGTESIGFKYRKSMRVLFQDLELLKLCTEFSNKFPLSTHFLMEGLNNHPQEINEILQKGSESAEIEELISKLQDPQDLVVFNQLLTHPKMNQKIVSSLIPLLANFPVHAKLIGALMQNELDHPSLAGLTLKLLNRDNFVNSGNALSVIDFLHCFLIQDRVSFQEETTLVTLLELIEKRPEIIPFLDRLSDFSPEFNERVLHQLQDLNQKNPDLCIRLLKGNTDLIFTFALGGILSKQSIEDKKIEVLLDWIDRCPDDYAALSKILNFWPSYSHFNDSLKPLPDLLWLAIAHIPEQVHLSIEGSCGIPHPLLNSILFETNRSPLTAPLIEKQLIDSLANSERVINFDFLFKKGIDLHRRLLKHPFLSEKERRELNLLLFNEQAMLCRKLLMLYYNQPELAKQFLHLAAVRYESALTMQVLSFMKAHPQASLSKLYQRALAADDVAVLKALATLEKKSSNRATKVEIRKLFDECTSLEDGQAFQKIKTFAYGQANRREEKESSSEQGIENFQTIIKECFDNVGSFSLISDVQHKMAAFQIVQLIVNKIVSSEGKIQLNQIDPILQELSEPLPLSPLYVLQIKNLLIALKSNPKIVEALESLKLPSDLDPSAAFLLRASEGLPLDAPLPLEVLQKTVLITLALHTRQLPQVGSCVGSSQLNALLSDPERALTFVSKFLTAGKISVEYQYQKIDIRFSPRLNDAILSHPILMTTACNLIKKGEATSLSIAQHPGILKMAKFLKIPSELYGQWIQDALSRPEISIQLMEGNAFSVNSASLIKTLVLSAINLQPELVHQKNLLALCEVLYLSSFDNLTSRVLEGIMTSVDVRQKNVLSEAFGKLLSLIHLSKQTEIRPLDNEDSLSILQHQIRNGEGSPCAFPPSLMTAIFSEETHEINILWKHVVKTLEKQFAHNIDVVFDPSIGRKILVDRTQVQEGPPEVIDTPEKFLTICDKTFEMTIEAVNAYFAEHPEFADAESWWKEVSFELKSYLGSNRFLNAYTLLFSHISPDISYAERKKESVLLQLAPLNHQKSYVELPWHFIEGANLENSLLMLNPLGKNSQWKMIPYCCKNGDDLSDYLVLLTKHIDFTQEKFQILPGGIPKHAINFSFKHPAIKAFTLAENKEEWIQNNCIKTAQQVSNKFEISLDDYREICQKLEGSLPISLREKWTALTENTPTSLTLNSIYPDLMKKLSVCLGTRNSSLSPSFNQLDKLLLSYIPGEERKKCRVLPFIDTNWYDEEDHADLYFALFFSPISLKWELWKVDDSHMIEKVDDKMFFTPNDVYTIYYTI
jgi:hypothetical protein